MLQYRIGVMAVLSASIAAGAAVSAFEHYYAKMTNGEGFRFPFVHEGWCFQWCLLNQPGQEEQPKRRRQREAQRGRKRETTGRRREKRRGEEA